MKRTTSGKRLVHSRTHKRFSLVMATFMAVTVTVIATSVYRHYLSRAGTSSLIPAKVVAGYWQMWQGPNVSEVTANAPQYNLQYASFAVGSDGNGNVAFNPVFQSGSSLKNDIAASKAKGSLWLISIGGGSDTTIRLTNESQATNMFNSLVGIIDSYGFQGIDYDIECGSGCISPSAGASLAAKLKGRYGPNFIISMAPRPYEARNGGLFTQVAKAIGDNLDLYGLQFYDFPEASNTSQLTSIINSDIANVISQGIPASKILIGCITYSGYGGGHNTVDVYKNIFLQQQQKYPDLRGVFIWETSLDKKENWSFAKTMGPALGAQPAPTGSGGVSTTPTPVPQPAQEVSASGNLLAGKYITSSVAESTTEPGHAVSALTDGNGSTRWISQPTSPVTLTADLGNTYTLTKISLKWAGDTTKNYSLQVSTDNSTWATIASGTTGNFSPQYIDHTSFTATATGRYLRIVGADRWNSSYGNSLWEIGAYGAAAAGDTTPPVIALNAPAAGASLKGTVSVSGTASDANGVSRVELVVDGGVKATNNAANANFSWISSTVSDGNHTLALRAYDAAGNSAISSQVNISVNNQVAASPPAIMAFSANPATITAGSRTTLNWATTSAIACSVNPNGPQLSAATFWQTPNLSTAGYITYTLTCVNGTGATTSRTTSVTVNAPAIAPSKPQLVASSTLVAPGTSVTLSWVSSGATSCIVNPGSVSASGSAGSFVTGKLMATTRYSVTCRNSAGSATSDAVVVAISDSAVPASAPQIVSLFADPARIAAGQSSTIYWSTTGVAAGACNLSPSPLNSANPNGSWTTPYLLGSKNYTLTCAGQNTQTVSKSVSVIVNDIIVNTPVSPVLPTTNIANSTQSTIKASNGQPVSNSAVATTVSGLVTLDPSNITNSNKERSIIKVEYYEADAFIQADTVAPFALDSAKLANGSHTITERTYFNDGSKSEVIRVLNIDNLKTVSAQGGAGVIGIVVTVVFLVLAAGVAVILLKRNKVTVSSVRSRYGNMIDASLIDPK